ncbi:hypothetical protein [Pseudomonas fulva]|jgi:hypothetical protein|uniref:hypothetical protein n=1 Tax=Pseudomonas fulva TaxID=47880 RepID=UPI00191DDFC7|nr:hypothetical protein [Pseudomonas fulva]MBN4165054.1 hypothetical protein [Pseudomonas fulva]
MSKFAAYDQALLAQIDSGNQQYSGLCRSLADLGKKVSPDREPWRTTDARLQAVRKSGAIAYDRSRDCWYRVIPD